MASEIRVDKINSLSGVGTVTLSPTGVDIAGITTAATLRATTGIVTSLTAGSLTSLGAVSGTTGTFSGAVSGTTGTFSGAVSGTTGTFSGAVSGTTGTFTGDVDIADKIIHTGDTNTAIRFPEADTITFETTGFEQVRIDNDVQMFVEANSKQAKLQLHREDASIDAGDVVGQITFTGRDAGGVGTQRVGAAISAVASNNWDTTQSSGYSATHLDFYTQAQQFANSTLTPRLRITSGGEVGINNSSPDNLFKLDVNGGVRIGNNVDGIIIENAGSNANVSNAACIRRHASTGNLHITAGTSIARNLIFGTKTSGGEIARFTDTGLCFNGDTAAANALDDYEEGTWTPTCNVGTLSYGHTSYTKIGRMVYISTYVNNFSNRSSAAAIEITSLPFAPANESDCGACVFYRVDHTDEAQIAARTSTDGNDILFLVSSQGGSDSWFHLTHSDLNHTNSQIKFSIWYPVA